MAGMDGIVTQAIQDSCVATVIDFIPDICPNYVKLRGTLFDFNPELLINYIMDEEDNGRPYPKNPALRTLKRKHEESEGMEKPLDGLRKYANAQPNKKKKMSGNEKAILIKLVIDDFPYTTSKAARSVLEKNDWRIFPSYLAVQKTGWQMNLTQQEASKKGAKRRPGNAEAPNNLKAFENNATRESYAIDKDILEEHDAARELAIWNERFERPQFAAKQNERQETAVAKARGDLIECQCCFDEFVDRKLVCCQSITPHWFCIDCMRQYAETLVGSSTYEMSCLSTVDKCSAGFSLSERNKFLDKKLQQALDRIEAEAVLRLAGLDSLETCPFCPYAAEYPSVEENKEFRCENPECAVVSCRLCRKKTHLPKRCEEVVEDMVTGARRAIEEAMTDALVRKCNKCQTPFVKEAGCNKMHCMQRGCGHSQCYICGKSMEKNDYSHFDSKNESGCKVWDNSEVRHQKDVEKAEAAARKKVADENPELDHEQLQIKHSEKVTEDLNNARKRWRNGNLGGAHYQRQGLGDFPRVAHLGIGPELEFFAARQRHIQQQQMRQLQHEQAKKQQKQQQGQARMQQAGGQFPLPPQAPAPQVQPALFAPIVAAQPFGVGAAPEARYPNHPLLVQVAGEETVHGHLKKAETPEAGAAMLRVVGTVHSLNERFHGFGNLQLLRQHYQNRAQQSPQAQQPAQAQQQAQLQSPRVVQPNVPQTHPRAFKMPDHAGVQDWLRGVGAVTGVSTPATGPAPIQQFQGQLDQNHVRNLRPLPHRAVRAQPAKAPAMVPMQQHANLGLHAPVQIHGDGLLGNVAGHELQFGLRYGNIAAFDNVARGRALQRPLE